MNIVLLALGIFLLIKSADWFVEGSSNLAKSLGISPLIIGLTVVALGTSAPEASISIIASIKGMNDIAISNVVGSNISNLLLILGIGGLFAHITPKKKVMTRDFRFLLFSSVTLLVLNFSFLISGKVEGIITRTNGILLLFFLGLYLYTLFIDSIKDSKDEKERRKFKFLDIVYIIIGAVGLIIGGQFVVNSAVEIASWLKISQNLIALTIVAVGTSLPELATIIVSVKKGEKDIAIGNIVGSNIFNIFFVLGLSSAISPITFGVHAFTDIVIMVIVGFIIYLMLLKNKHIGKKSAIIMLAMYAIYVIYLFIR